MKTCGVVLTSFVKGDRPIEDGIVHDSIVLLKIELLIIIIIITLI